MHTRPDDTWVAILNTRTLTAVSLEEVDSPEGQWVRFALRGMRPLGGWDPLNDKNWDPKTGASKHHQTQTVSIKDQHGRPVKPDSDGRFTVFHMIQLSHLIAGHPWAPGSAGILGREPWKPVLVLLGGFKFIRSYPEPRGSVNSLIKWFEYDSGPYGFISDQFLRTLPESVKLVLDLDLIQILLLLDIIRLFIISHLRLNH